MVGNMRKRKKGKKKTKEQEEDFAMAVRTVLKQPEKNAQRDPLKRDGLAITVERRGTSSGIALRLLSHPWVHVLSSKDRTGETAPRDIGPRGQTLRTIKTEGTHTSSHSKYT